MIFCIIEAFILGLGQELGVKEQFTCFSKNFEFLHIKSARAYLRDPGRPREHLLMDYDSIRQGVVDLVVKT